jgi:CheY-like chemotaxis protein
MDEQPASRVLIVEDQFFVAEYLQVWIETFGLTVCGVVQTAEAAVETALAERPDCLLLDYRLRGDMDGAEAARRVRAVYQPRIIFITGSFEADSLARMREAGAFEVLPKPIDPQRLKEALFRLG